MSGYNFFFLLILFFSGKAICQAPDSLARIFDYTRVKPSYTIDSVYSISGIIIKMLTYAGADSFMVSAYLTHPEKDAEKHPLIIFNHWGEGNKSEFLDEAISFSAKGFVCLLPDAPWLCPGSAITSYTQQGSEMVRQAVINSRTGLDLAEALFEIDSSEIFCIGHSFGCGTAAILSGIEERIDGYVFMTGVYSATKSASATTRQDFVDWRTGSPDQFRQWVIRMEPLDAEHYVPLKKVPCLIQVADQDEYITAEENELFIRMVPDPKVVRRYKSAHILNMKARKDRKKWVLTVSRES